MHATKLSIGVRATLVFVTVALFAAGTVAVAQREERLYSFGSRRMDAAYPVAGLIFDDAGNLYGTSFEGGAYNEGTVFELMRKAGGGWTEKILHSFGRGADGTYPGANLILDARGNLYGTTSEGGTKFGGTVFELTPKAGGGWTEKLLYSFGGYSGDAALPYAGLILDASGNLYGTSFEGGDYNEGTVFELTHKAGAGWMEKLLYSFGSHSGDATLPFAGLILDAGGDLYGTTVSGGAYVLGAVFELTPKVGGKWAEKVLHSFNGKDGEGPDAGLIFDHGGNLYGATATTIFELTRKAGGAWTEKLLSPDHGTVASLIFGAGGNLYGTDPWGGSSGYGMAFELRREAGGKWRYLSLHEFTGGEDGADPDGGLILGASGDMYGTTHFRGGHKYGTVFEITP
jgi:uncharacterized repeat protein (TIGR03803 family)